MCDHPIRGNRRNAGALYEPPFCGNCGKEFPWTERRVEAAKALVEESDGLSESEKETRNNAMSDTILIENLSQKVVD